MDIALKKMLAFIMGLIIVAVQPTRRRNPHYSPVYGMDVNRIYVDRLIDIMKFMPPERMSS